MVLAGSAAKELGPDELMRMLLRGGISTSKAVTEESGRGIGLDVVRAAVERLGGEVGFQSVPGSERNSNSSFPVARVDGRAAGGSRRAWMHDGNPA